MTPEEFKSIRVDFGATQEEWAKELGVSRKQIGLWESGKASISRITALAIKALELMKAVEINEDNGRMTVVESCAKDVFPPININSVSFEDLQEEYHENDMVYDLSVRVQAIEEHLKEN